MGWFSKEGKKPKCERDFERGYEDVRQRMLRRTTGKGFSILIESFPIQKDWVQPFLLEEQLGFALLQRQLGQTATVKATTHMLRGEYWKHQHNLGLLDERPAQSAICVGDGAEPMRCPGRMLWAWLRLLREAVSHCPRLDKEEERLGVKVWNYCTVECACCIEFRGCYTPDSRLPPPVL